MIKSLLLSLKKIGLSLVLLVGMLVLVGNVFGANRYSVANGNWSSASTWASSSGGTSGASAPTSGDVVYIEGGYTVTLTSSPTGSYSISIDSGSTLALGVYNVTASALTVYCGGIAGASITGTGTLTLAGNVTVTDATTGTVGATISCPISIGATRTFTVADDGTTATDLDVSGVISGAFGLTKAGSGTMVLSGSNTYTGITTVSAGTLGFSSIQNVNGGSSALGAPTTVANGTIAIGATGILKYTGTGHTSDRVINVTADGGTIDASGSGTLTLIGGKTGNNNNLVLTGTGNAIESGVIGSGNATLTKNGTGTWALSGANTYTGATVINAGVLNVQNATALGTTASGTTVVSGAVLQLQGGITVGNELMTLNGTGISSTGALRNISGDNGWGGTITINSTTEITSDDGLLTLNVASGNSITGSNDNLIFDGSGNIEVSDPIATGTGTLTKSGGGTLTLSGANTYTGSTSISAGTLKLGNASALGTNASGTSVTNSAVLDLNGITLSTAEALSINGTGISGGGALTNNSTTGATYSGVITFASAASIVGENGTIAITGTPATGTTAITLGGSAGGSISTVIAGARTLTKEGSGTWTLSGANTYTGSSTISDGKLKLNPGTNITPATQFILNGGDLSTEGITANRTITSSKTFRLDANSSITLGTNAHTLSFAASNGETWSANKTLTISGWTGNWDGTSGTAGKIFFGSSTSGLTSTQLSQIQFFDGSDNVEAIILSTGEVVPRRKVITTGAVSTSPFCVSASTSASGTVAYTSTGVISGATFTAKLSDASGSFASSADIGTATVTGTNPSGTINITIPAGTASGTGYKIRIDCTTPAITGSESSAFTIVNGVSNVTSFAASDDDASSSLSWTNPTNCFDEVLIVAKANSSVTGTPTGNGSAYTANLNFGSGTSLGGGYVVYKGSSSPQTISGLINGTTYYIKVFTRNNTDWSSGLETTANPSSASLATDYFRSKTSGNWNSAATWQSSHDGTNWINSTLYPTSSANSILIQTGHTVFATSSPTSNSLIVNGTYEHQLNGGTIPSATWASNSTCLVTGMTSTSPSGLGQSYGNFTWDCTNQTGTVSTNNDIIVNADFTLSAGTFSMSNGNDRTMTVAGDFIQTGGVFDFNAGTIGNTTLYLVGNLLNTVTPTPTDGSISTLGAGAPNGMFVFNGTGVQNLTFTRKDAAKWVGYRVETSSTLNLQSDIQLYGDNSATKHMASFAVNGTLNTSTHVISQLSGTGSTSFSLNSGASLITANSGGISTTAGIGSVQITDSKTFSATANYTYNGSSAQVTGNALTGAANLTFDNASGVTLSSPVAVSGSLNFNSGIVTTSSTNLLTVTNTSTAAISGGNSTTFINGPVKWTLPASLTSGSAYGFPLGKGSKYLPFTLENPTTGTGTITAQLEAFATSSGGSIDATLDSKSTSEYWELTISGNFTNSSISVDRSSAITPFDAIAGSLSQSGTYTSLEGTTSITGVSNSYLIGNNRFFVLAEKKKNTISTGTISGAPFCQGVSVSVPFSISGTYNSGNIFTAQLSDASGSFGSPVAIGSLTSTVAGTISATIPVAQTSGAGYRIRVVSSNPSVTGSDNGSSLSINELPSAPLVGTVVQPTCDVATGSVTLNGLPSGIWTLTMSPGDVKTTGSGSSKTISDLPAGTYSFTVTGEDNSISCPGSGNGLKGEYFNVMDLSGTPVLTRTDATVDFNWGSGTPGSPVNVNNFSVRWSGKVQACYTENYTFTTRSDDGIRLWVNGSQIINNWGDHAATNNSGNISLVAGQKYDIVLEFYENGGDAVSQLSWSSTSQASQIIPQTQLYSEATGCSSASSANVIINPQPVNPSAPTSVTPSSATSICEGGSINLRATSAGNTIYWYTQASGGTSIGTSASGANFSVSPVAGTTYYAEAQSPEGCVSASRTATGLISITPNLSAVTLSSTTQQDICIEGSGTQLSVSETGGGTITARQWGKRSTSGGPITAISGATSSTYTPTGADLGAGTWFLVCTSTPTCGTELTSNEITVVVSESIGGTLTGGTSPSCIGSTTGTLTLTGYTGSIVRWERKINSGSWESLGNTGNNTFSDVAFYATGTIKYRVAVKNATCAEAYSSEVSIDVDAASVGGWISYVDPICEGSSVTLVLNGSVGNVVRWEKHLGAGAWSSVSGTSTTLTDTPSSGGSWEYRAVVKSGSCPEANSSPITVTVNPTLTITLGANPEICQTTGSTVIPYTATTGSPEGWVLTFNATAISAGFSSPQNGSISSTSGNIPVNVPYDVVAGTYHANLKVIKYTPVCSSVDYPVTVTVNANSGASVSIVADQNNVCSGTSVTYTATPVNGGSNPGYQWKVNGNNAGTNSSTFAYSPANNDDVICVLTSSATCATGSPATSNTITMSVNAELPVSVSISADQNNTCAGTSVTFTASATNGGTTPSFQWKVNGNNVGTNITTYSYIPANNDQVTCVLTSNATCATGNPATSNTVSTIVKPLPTASISGTTTVCPNTSSPQITFTGGGSTTPYTFTYKINGGPDLQVGTTSGNSVTVDVPTTTSGDFIYSLVSVADATGCSQNQTGSATVTVHPQMNITHDAPTDLCQYSSQMVTASVSGGSGNYTYQWEIVTSGASLLFIPGPTSNNFIWITGYSIAAGNYQYRLTVTDTTLGCTKVVDFTIAILANLSPNWLTSTSTVCAGQTGVVYAVQNHSGTTYSWTVTGGTIAEGAGTSQIKVNWGSTSGNFSVELTATTGSCTQTFSKTVTINALPTINPGTNPSVCSGATTADLHYSSATGSPTRYSVDFDSDANAAGFADILNAVLSGSNITFTLPNGVASGTYNGALTVKNNITGCESNVYPISITINPNLPVSVSIAASDNPSCKGLGVTYTATPVNGGTSPEYQWKVNGNDVGTNSSTYTYVPQNGDVVSCVLSSDATCATGTPATSNTIAMTVNELTGNPVFTAGATIVCQDDANETYTATAAHSVSISYSVLPAGAGTINSSTGEMNWAASFYGTATITATATGLCDIKTVDRTVTVNPLPTPAAITAE